MLFLPSFLPPLQKHCIMPPKLRRQLLSFLLLLFFPGFLIAQDSLTVTEGMNASSLGAQPSFSVVIPQAKMKDVLSGWKKYIKQGTKKSVEEESKELILSQAVIPALGLDTFTVFARAEAADNGIRFISFYHWNDSIFMSSSVDVNKSEKIIRLVRQFAVEQYKRAVDYELEASRRSLSELNRDLDDLNAQNGRSEKNIKEYERSIDRLKSEIKINEKESELKSDEVMRQKLLLESFQGTPEAKTAEDKKFKELSKQKKRLQSDNESMHKDIDDFEDKIKSRQKTIKLNTDELIPAKKEAIMKQEATVKFVEEKLKSIR